MASLRDQVQSSLEGSYTIERELGGGGMSHVFLATDAELDRQVVVKVLPADAAAALSAERFKREIALCAKLQHAHIVPLLSAGFTDTQLPYYTMPYVEGESLRGRLSRTGELPVAEVVSILKDVGRALAYAHAHGVVHRDIKPDNVMLSGGAAVVTDFGVAKAVSAAAGPGSATTITQLGVALGTPAYMAPEQAAAEPVIDHRADLYAFGCMAYEMLAGQPPFTGRNASAMLAAQVAEKPEPIERRRPNTPAALATLVMRCLEKRPADRPASADEVLRLLDTVSQTPAETPAAARTTTTRHTRLARYGTVVVGSAIVVALAFEAGNRMRPAPSAGTVRFALGLPADEVVSGQAIRGSIALSPDGKSIVYVARTGGGSHIGVRRLDELNRRELVGTEGGTNPFVSRDGQWIGYVANGSLMKVPVQGGAPTSIVEVGSQASAAWAPNGVIVVGASSFTRGLSVVSEGGGTLRQLTTVDTLHGETEQRYPRLLSDGETILFTSWRSALNSSELGVASLRSGESHSLGIAGTYPLGVHDGVLYFAAYDGTLMCVPFNLSARKTTGTPVPAVERVSVQTTASADVALGNDGTLVYLQGAPPKMLALSDARGSTTLIDSVPRQIAFPRFSPDGRRIAATITSAGSTQVWIYEVASGTATRLTAEGSLNDRAEWMPDGRRVVFRSNRDGKMRLWWQSVDGATPAERVTTDDITMLAGGPSPDGKFMVARVNGAHAPNDLWTLSLEGDRRSRPFVTTPGVELSPQFSPNGQWVAYGSDEGDAGQAVYVRPFPGPGAKYRVSLSSGVEPNWSRDGNTLYYRNREDGAMIAASLTTTPTFAVTRREKLAVRGYVETTHGNYDVSPDGSHFLVVIPSGDGPHVIVVLHWFDEVRALLKGR